MKAVTVTLAAKAELTRRSHLSRRVGWAGVILACAGLGAVVAGSAATATAPAQRGATRSRPANDSSGAPTISADGRFVGFESDAENLVAGDTNDATDVFVRDRVTGTTERVSVSSRGAQARGSASGGELPALSANGRFVSFDSGARNLVAGDTNRAWDVFVRDRVAGTIERVDVSSSGHQANRDGVGSVISADGRFVAFVSWATNLVADDTNGDADVFVRDRMRKTTERDNLSSAGGEANAGGGAPAISSDGRFVAFLSGASNLVAGDTNKATDVFVRDRVAGTTERVNVSSSGAQAGSSTIFQPAISADGRFVAFASGASLVPGDTGRWDVFVRDRVAATTERISVGLGGEQASRSSEGAVAISPYGRFVAFESTASNLVVGDTNEFWEEVFVRDRATGTTEKVSVSTGGAEPNSDSSDSVAISADGRFIAFPSYASNLVAGDTNIERDVFVRDRMARTTTLVSAGKSFARAGVLALRPWPARAGRQLSATMPVSIDGEPVGRARVTCTATLAGRRLPATMHSLRAGVARCVWRVPVGARGRKLSGSVYTSTANGTAGQRFFGHVA